MSRTQDRSVPSSPVVSRLGSGDDGRSWVIRSGRADENRRAVRDGTDLSRAARITYAMGLVPGGEYEDRLGRSLKQMQRYANGSDMPLSVLEKLAVESGLPLAWIVSGEAVDEEARLGTGGPIVPTESLNAFTGFVAVPRLSVQASAGPGLLALEGSEPSDVVAFREGWLRRIGVTPVNAQVLKAVGDSMEPTIRDGDLLLVDRGISQVIDNGIYIVVVAGLVLVKRLQTRFDGSLTLISDNRERYDPETIAKDRLHELTIEGRVRWYGRSI